MTIIDQARQFAIDAHGDQKRKYTGFPYWHHCRNVAILVATATEDPTMIAAAWLHDVLEDTDTTAKELFQEFGSRITDLVVDLTDIVLKGAGNRATRKAKECKRMAGIHPDAKTIKLADLIDNASDIVEGDPKFARLYLAEKAELLKVLGAGDIRLWEQADAVLLESWKRLEAVAL